MAMSTSRQDRPAGPALERWLNRIGESNLLYVLLGITLLVHAYNMFRYPLYLGDEGIYMEQAWAVLREGALAPYTYFYDHAPAGWLLIAFWVWLLPGKFYTFGPAINSGRVLMLILHEISVVLLFKVTKRLSGSTVASFVAVIVFSLSPLSVFYQRMVLLDNIMVFWLLLAMYAILYDGNRLLSFLASGTTFGIALLTKENAIFFAPVLVYLVYHSVHGTYRYRFAYAGWMLAVVLVVSLYPLYALLKSEFFPSGTFDFIHGTPGQHVSLISTVLWQMSRSGGSILDPNGGFWFYFWSKWWPRDGLIIILGAVAVPLNLIIWRLNRARYFGYLIAAAMALAFFFYLARGSVMIEFYVVPILPFLGMNAGMAVAFLLNHFPSWLAAPTFPLVLAALAAAFLYVGRDAFRLDQTYLQVEQVAYIRQHIPANAFIIIDDDIWVDLHEASPGNPVFPYAESHWKVESDPAIRDKLLHNDWQNTDYIAKSNEMQLALEQNQSNFVLKALNNSTLMKKFQAGQIELEVRKINK